MVLAMVVMTSRRLKNSSMPLPPKATASTKTEMIPHWTHRAFFRVPVLGSTFWIHSGHRPLGVPWMVDFSEVYMHSRMQLVVLQKRMRPTMRANQWEMVRAAASEAPKLDARVKPRFFMMMTAALPMLI